MASIRKELPIAANAEGVWDALRDVGEVHRRVVTFANGLVAKELIVDVDDGARRLVWSARTERLSHHNASVQVFDEGPARCRLVWIADVLPHEAAAMVGAMMDAAVASMRETLAAHSQAA